MPDALATPSQLAEWLGVTIEAASADETRAERLLSAASGLVRRKARQTYSLVADDAVVLHGSSLPVLPLPQRPVVSVASVQIDEGTGPVDVAATSWTLLPSGMLRRTDGAAWGRYGETRVLVTYTHGHATVPDHILAIVLSVAARAWVNPAGVLSQNLDGYSVTFGGPSAFARGGVSLTREEAGILRAERPRL